MSAPAPSKALLLGSINVPNNKEAFTVAAKTLGSKLRYFPDGETGSRWNWIRCQIDHIPKRIQRDIFNPNLEAADQTPISPDPPLDASEFLPTKYDTWAIESYAVFRELRQQGLIQKGQRMQVCIPSPLNFLTLIQSRYALAAEAFVEARVVEALKAIQDAIPAEDLCIQWDMPIEIFQLEYGRMTEMIYLKLAPYIDNPLDGAVERIVRLSSHINPDVALGMHLCYGDFGHKHFIEPVDTKVLTTFMNAVDNEMQKVRKINYFHIPVPKERDDEAYFEPLKELKFEGDLYLGLVREGDEEGARRRVQAARNVLDREFGVGTECGLGRVDSEDVPSVFGIMDSITSS